jgi:hypothetical protein
MMKRFITLLLTGALIVFSFGCSKQAGEEPAVGSPDTSATTPVTVEPADESGFDFSYSDRDLDPSYDEATATRITLSGTSVNVEGEGAQVDGSIVTISAEGTYIVSGKLSNGSIVVEALDEDAKVQLVLDGVEITSTAAPAILVEQADKVFITLAEGSSNVLSDGSGRSDLATLAAGDAETTETEDDHATHDGVIFSHDDLTINGSGSLKVTAASTHAIVSKDDLVITGGEYSIEAAGDGLQGKDCVKIADGTLDIVSGDDAIVSNNATEPDTAGFVSLDGGTITIAATDDAVHAETILRAAGGDVTVSRCEEGYEGAQIWIQGGSHYITASDDGVNAAGDARTDYLLDITGGYLEIDAEGDGIDSNGIITQSGGEVVVFGPTRSGNGAIDSGQGASISGGSLIALCAAGMDEGYGSGSTQAALLYNAQQTFAAGSVLSLRDANGNELFSLTAKKQFSSVALSAPELTLGGSYTFSVDGVDVTSFTLSESPASVAADGTVNAYAGGEGFGGMGGGRGGTMPGGGAAPGGGTAPSGDMPTDGDFGGTPPQGGFGGGTPPTGGRGQQPL